MLCMHAPETDQAEAEGGADQPVVVYDGECPFCLKQVEKMKRRDTAGAFEFVPRQADGLELRFPRLEEGNFDSGMRLVHTDGTISVGADAVYHIARRLDRWKYLAWLYRVPILKSLCRAVYAWVAANRYRLAKKCRTPVCKTGGVS